MWQVVGPAVTDPNGDMVPFTDHSGRWRLTDKLSPGGYTVESLQADGRRLRQFDIRGRSWLGSFKTEKLNLGTVVVSPEFRSARLRQGVLTGPGNKI
jgi:hypothetical protein